MPSKEAINLTITKLSKLHILRDFKCGQQKLDDFIQKEALSFREEGLGITYVAFSDNELVGFVTISMADVRTKHMGDHGVPIGIENYPALQIGQLGVNEKIQRKGIGTQLVKWCMNKAIELSKDIGCRLLVLNSIPTSVGFYKNLNFIELKNQKGRQEKTMYLVIPKELYVN